MKISQFLFTFAAMAHVPISMFTGRQQIYSFYGIGKTDYSHVTVTLILNFIGCFIPCVYPDISGLLGLLGGLTIGGSGYVMPFLLRVLSLKDLSFHHPKRFFFVLLFLFSFVVASLSMSVSICKYFDDTILKIGQK